MNDYPVTNVQEWCGDDDVLDRGLWTCPPGLYWDIDKAQGFIEEKEEV